jgi:hypothetical protein
MKYLLLVLPPALVFDPRLMTFMSPRPFRLLMVRRTVSNGRFVHSAIYSSLGQQCPCRALALSIRHSITSCCAPLTLRCASPCLACHFGPGGGLLRGTFSGSPSARSICRPRMSCLSPGGSDAGALRDSIHQAIIEVDGRAIGSLERGQHVFKV